MLLLGAVTARAGDRFEGAFTLTAHEAAQPAFEVPVSLTVTRAQDGSYTVARQVEGGPLLSGVGHASGDRLVVEFPTTGGAARAVERIGVDQEPYRATYQFSPTRIAGRGTLPSLRTPSRRAEVRESAERATAESQAQAKDPVARRAGDQALSGAVRIERPGPGSVWLVGSTVPVMTAPVDAQWQAKGPAKRAEDGAGLVLEGPGEVQLRARHGGEISEVVAFEAVAAEVVEVAAIDAFAVVDAAPPHYRRALGAAKPDRMVPVALPLRQPLRLRVTLQTSKEPSSPTVSTLELRLGGKAVASAPMPQAGLAGGVAVEVTLPAQWVGDRLGIKQLSLNWALDGRVIANHPLRLHVTFGPPIENDEWLPESASEQRQQQKLAGRSPLMTAVHLENACFWVQGASKNVASGPDSIALLANDGMRHYVHPKDVTRPIEPPAVADYPPGAPVPVNYHALSGEVQGDTRVAAQVYYPPIKPTEDFERFQHYSRNYGWRVLDDPAYPGGRCNQQASLLADVLGTLGVQAGVHYMERRGRAARTGRPARQYFETKQGGTWNFHAVTWVTLEDGSRHYYDHSFSPTPGQRLHGTLEQMQGEGGLFLKSWGGWYYEDTGQVVPATDWPGVDSWSGAEATAAERAAFDRRRADAGAEEDRYAVERKAADELFAARAKKREEAAAYVSQGAAHEKAGRVDSALLAYEQALRVSPSASEAKDAFARVALREAQALFTAGKGASWYSDDDETKFRAARALIVRYGALPGLPGVGDQKLKALLATIDAEL